MSFCNPADSIAPSEDFSQPHFSGTCPSSLPKNIDQWCQSVPYGGADLPLTPPDTSSECSFADTRDMCAQWTSAPPVGEPWTTEHGTTDHSAYGQQPSAGQWPSSGYMRSTETRSQNMIAPSWMNTFPGSVDLGFSPVSSYECQTSRSLESFANPDLSVLPPNLDLSFIEPNWTATDGSVMYTEHSNAQQPTGQVLLSPAYTEASTAAPPSLYAQQSMPDLGHDVQSLHSFAPTPVSAGQSSDAHLDSFAVPAQRVPRFSRMPSQDSVPSLSSVHSRSEHRQGMPHGPAPSSTASVSPVPPATFHSGNFTFASGYAGNFMPQPYGQYQDVPRTQESAMQPPAVSRSARDMSGADGAAADSNVSYALSREDASAQKSASPKWPNPAMEAAESNDDGRYRNHPLYSQKPLPDGLYHCPFEGEDPTCTHKPTKLKCNYDKFIDSHLKPFRCKVESCSKEKFSSTACLLRHEREAHGMHGHGDRPHLCYYPGCERGVPGNGFPRRYNLFDHMKRVHDHKETIAETAKAEKDERKAAGRKRKADDSPPAGSSAPKVPRPAGPHHAGPPPAVVHGLPAVHQPNAVAFELRMPDQSRRVQEKRAIYSQWAQQRELLARQMEFVESPEDEASLHRLNQNIAEFRRLSDEARRG